MNKGSVFFISLIILTFTISAFLVISCKTEGDEFRHKPLMAEDGENYAKNMDEDTDCRYDNVIVQDCLDACTCCHWGDTDGIENCVESCDSILIRYQDYPAYTTDIDNYKECVVGCYSVCEKTTPRVMCWDECKKYIGDA